MNRADEPAYPQPDGCRDYGLTVREHFAGLAMQGILAGDHPITHELNCEANTAEVAVAIADALIAELAKEQPK